MSQSQKKGQRPGPPASAASGRKSYLLAAVVIALAVMAAVGYWWIKGRQAGTSPAGVPEAAVDAAKQPALAATHKPEFEKLAGRWLRPDGGYIIEIRSIEPGGRMNAAYFNPQPINVAKAEASHHSGTIQVFIELRDANYPGSKYDLAYDRADDRLKGTYFQAAIGQTFDVYFVRMQP